MGGRGKKEREENVTFNSKCSFTGLGLGVFVAILNLVHVHVIIPLTGSLAAKSPIYNVHIKIAQSPSQYRLTSCNVPYVHCIYCYTVQR